MDTSALVKRYITETGSKWVEALTDPTVNNQIIVARLTRVEVVSAFYRLRREGKIDANDVAVELKAFQHDWNTQYQIVEVDNDLAEAAVALVQKYPLRAYDSVQLSAALKVNPAFAKLPIGSFTFIAADNRLLNAAQAEGLPVDDPNKHP
ncbi:MAG: VapC toxin family PIN domain ribonuclease [Candidatus Cloacimonetes bacterium 4572_55]|nr:MAG: VapC toxin family PIN domain ribonuclease [Candidatus Cloacimonetes bacterium 4572_55]